jgi:hypothetical protein
MTIETLERIQTGLRDDDGTEEKALALVVMDLIREVTILFADLELRVAALEAG